MRKIIRILSVFLFISGLALFLYPSVTEWYAAYNSNKVKEEFEKDLDRLQNITDDSRSDSKSEEAALLDRLYSDMVNYNKKIFDEGQINLKDPFSYEMPSFKLKNYGLKNNVIGIITIPSIEVELPLYLGANESNMTKGAVVLGQTSMPTGGINTNSVIAAHRGYKGIKMFRDIEKIKLGDEIQIKTIWNTLYYSVTGIKVVLPDEIGNIYIQSGKDMITLVTCHPYTKNSHRYLVYAQRCNDGSVDTDKEDVTVADDDIYGKTEIDTAEYMENNSSKIIWLETYLPYIGGGVVIMIGFICIYSGRTKKNPD